MSASSQEKLPLSSTRLFADLSPEELAEVRELVEEIRFELGSDVVREGDESDALYVILEGEVRVYRGDLALSVYSPGSCFGELGMMTTKPRAGSVRALTPLTVARFSRQALETLATRNPALVLKLFGRITAQVRRVLTDVTDSLEQLLRDRARPLRVEVEARLPRGPTKVKAGTLLRRLLPLQIDGEPVVAALLDGKPVPLGTPLFASATVEPVTRTSPVGREIYRRSVGLLLLEAARRLDPALRLRIGPSLGFAHIVEIVHANGRTREALAADLTVEMRELVRRDMPFRRERWTVEEASARFAAQGWDEAVRLLRYSRDTTVSLTSCGEVYAFEVVAKVPATGYLDRFELVVYGDDVLLYFGDETPRSSRQVRATHPGELAREHESWLNTLGATSVGAFNDLCVSGELPHIVQVSEGHHEKRISQIADEIVAAEEPVRVICISGPSSSGKTTFIQRLSVQLEVNGLMPRTISLDDYYVDRELTPKDASGEYDFEAFEALNLGLLGDHLTRLVKGETVQTAHYDFTVGKSFPNGGPLLTVGPQDVLLLEGIHALNPQLPIDQEKGGFRIFINPMTSLPLDRVARVSVSDVRMLRRIVRDRRKRAISAAQNIIRWPSVRRGERRHIFPYQNRAHAVFNSSLIYEPSVLKVYAERYLLEVPVDHPAYGEAYRLRRMIDRFVAIYPTHVPETSLLWEFIGPTATSR